ncbi:hypothetical protein CAJAP_09708 [Camponotus japonicus]
MRLGRRAKRRWSDGSSGGESPAAAGRGPVSGPPSLQAPANINNNLTRPCSVSLQRTLVRNISGAVASIPLQRTSAEGAPGERAGRVGAGRPSAPVSVPGVMGRRRGVPVTGGVGASVEGAPGARAGGPIDAGHLSALVEAEAGATPEGGGRTLSVLQIRSRDPFPLPSWRCHRGARIRRLKKSRPLDAMNDPGE